MLDLINMASYFENLEDIACRMKSHPVPYLVEHLVTALKHLKTVAHAEFRKCRTFVAASEDVLYLLSKIGSDWSLISDENKSVLINLIEGRLGNLKFCVRLYSLQYSNSTSYDDNSTIYDNACIVRSGIQVLVDSYKKYLHFEEHFDRDSVAIFEMYERELDLATFDAKLESFNSAAAAAAAAEAASISVL